MSVLVQGEARSSVGMGAEGWRRWARGSGEGEGEPCSVSLVLVGGVGQLNKSTGLQNFM